MLCTPVSSRQYKALFAVLADTFLVLIDIFDLTNCVQNTASPYQYSRSRKILFSYFRVVRAQWPCLSGCLGHPCWWGTGWLMLVLRSLVWLLSGCSCSCSRSCTSSFFCFSSYSFPYSCSTFCSCSCSCSSYYSCSCTCCSCCSSFSSSCSCSCFSSPSRWLGKVPELYRHTLVAGLILVGH